MAEKIRVGFPVPLSGTYGTEANEQLIAAQIAVDDFNSSGGLDGREAELVVRDTKLDKQMAIDATEELIIKEKVHVVVGALKSEDMVEISKVCDKYKIVYNAISQSDTILETKNRSKFTFHEGQNPHMTVGSVGRYAFSHFGTKVAFLSASSEFGQHSLRALLHVGQQIGVEPIAKLDYQVGLKDFRPQLEEIKKLKPEVLVLNNFGDDQLNSVVQAGEVGLKEETRLICPNFSPTQRRKGGPDAFEGVVGSCAYYWRLGERYETAKVFNKKVQDRSNGITPTSYSVYGYNGTKTVLTAIQKARSLDSEKIVHEMLGLRFDFCKGPQFYRQLDHQSVQSVIMVQSKTKSEMESEEDIFEILEVVEFLGPRTFLVSRETV